VNWAFAKVPTEVVCLILTTSPDAIPVFTRVTGETPVVAQMLMVAELPLGSVVTLAMSFQVTPAAVSEAELTAVSDPVTPLTTSDPLNAELLLIPVIVKDPRLSETAPTFRTISEMLGVPSVPVPVPHVVFEAGAMVCETKVASSIEILD